MWSANVNRLNMREMRVEFCFWLLLELKVRNVNKRRYGVEDNLLLSPQELFNFDI